MKLCIDFDARDAKKLLLQLILLELFFVFVYGVDVFLNTPSWSIHRLFDLDAEGTIPAWFSSIQFWFIGLVFLLKSRLADPDLAPSRLFFIIIGIGFMLLSADEAAGIHEQLNAALKNAGGMPRFKDGQGIWIYLYAVVGAGMFLANYRGIFAMWTRYGRECRVMTAGFGLILAGAVGLEIVSYQYLRTGATPGLYALEVAFEEFFEMCGASIILYGALLLLLRGPRSDHSPSSGI